MQVRQLVKFTTVNYYGIGLTVPSPCIIVTNQNGDVFAYNTTDTSLFTINTNLGKWITNQQPYYVANIDLEGNDWTKTMIKF